MYVVPATSGADGVSVSVDPLATIGPVVAPVLVR